MSRTGAVVDTETFIGSKVNDEINFCGITEPGILFIDSGYQKNV